MIKTKTKIEYIIPKSDIIPILVEYINTKLKLNIDPEKILNIYENFEDPNQLILYLEDIK